MTHRTPTAGDRIYHEGDSANDPSDGTVLRVYEDEWGEWMEVDWDNGHASRPITTDILATPRFGFIADRNAEKIAFWTRQARQYRADGETDRADMAMQVVAELKGASV